MPRICLLLFVSGLLAPASAFAIGLCEGLVDTAQVVSISESMRLVAVRRAVESCVATDGVERRELTRVVEVRDLDTGKVKQRFVAQAGADRAALVKKFGGVVGDWAAYTRLLKEGLFQVRPPVAKNQFCTVSLSLEAGGLVAIVDGRDLRGGTPKPLRATIRLIDAVAGGPAAQMARVWFVRNGAGLVFDLEAPVPARGPGPADHLSAVRIVPASEAPVLKGCATPRPTPKRLPNQR